ncbi:hypothetical protein D9613_007613 [Agrocybe pediades]|uniref:Uncharacterized protein n=1 Tax=Agrocybe pediades TaxID=84607 RepID=A0A8H4QMU3_9AGAR|nr:hypothetical protein D9613_007613 [Agrocybe pediades]
MNTPSSVNTLYFDALSHFPNDENDNNTMQSSQDLPAPVHTTAGPLYPVANTREDGTTATTFQLHDDGPVSAGSLTPTGKLKKKDKGKTRERSSSPAAAGGTGRRSLSPVSPLPELKDLNIDDTDANTHDGKAHGGVGATGGHEEYMLHPNGSEGWLPVAESNTQIHQQNLNAMPEPEHHQAAAAGLISPVRKVSPTPISPNGRRSASPNYNNGPMGGAVGSSLARSTSRKSTHTASDGRPIPGSAFVNGAGTTGPFSTAEEDEALLMRAQEANASLTPKQRSKIAKTEAKNGRKLSKIIKSEAKLEKQSLETCIAELAELQKIQKHTLKSIARLSSTHSSLLSKFKKTEAAYLSAKLKYEREMAELQAEESALEAMRERGREATEKVQDKAAECDALRRVLAVDEREREVRLGELSGKGMGTVRRKASVGAGLAPGQGMESQPDTQMMDSAPAQNRRSFFGGGGPVRN